MVSVSLLPFIEKYNLQHKKFLLAVSGGVDSMVMAHLFLSQKLQFEVAHCNFTLRHEESALDEKLVQAFCQKNNIKCHTTSFQTQTIATQNKQSIQETARNLRYDYFKTIAIANQIDYLATAHHQDDAVETLLFLFLRGTGMKGLTSINEKTSNIIRPLLAFTKDEIRAYANINHIEYREDKSNEKNDYTRNKIRNEVLPYLDTIVPQATQNMAANIKRFNAIEVLYNEAVAKHKKQLVEKRGNDFYIPLKKLIHRKPLFTILFEILYEFNFSVLQTQEAINIIHAQSGKHINSATHMLYKNRNFFIITSNKQTETDFIKIDKEQSLIITDQFTLEIHKHKQALKSIPTTENRVLLDAKHIQYPLVLRKWQEGDYMYPLGMLKKKKIARILIDLKIPMSEKEKIWVLENNNKHIVWLVGIRIDERYKITPQTKDTIQFTIK